MTSLATSLPYAAKRLAMYDLISSLISSIQQNFHNCSPEVKSGLTIYLTARWR